VATIIPGHYDPLIDPTTGGPSNPKGRSGGTTKKRIAEMCSLIHILKCKLCPKHLHSM
jgi:hypothetical protein